jgi:hypothetical protein
MLAPALTPRSAQEQHVSAQTYEVRVFDLSGDLHTRYTVKCVDIVEATNLLRHRHGSNAVVLRPKQMQHDQAGKS